MGSKTLGKNRPVISMAHLNRINKIKSRFEKCNDLGIDLTNPIYYSSQQDEMLVDSKTQG